MAHVIDFVGDHVAKYVAAGERDAHERELPALTLLAEHAPGPRAETVAEPVPRGTRGEPAPGETSDDPAHPRDQPGTARRQALRLLERPG